MAAVVIPTEEERYLLAILATPDGLDLAEFTWHDPESPDGCYRAWDFQWCLSGDTLVVTDEGSRPIRDLVGEVNLLTVASDESVGTWTPARVNAFGIRRLWEVALTRRGVRKIVRTTNKHTWLASNQRQSKRRVFTEIATEDLQPGTWLKSARAPAAPRQQKVQTEATAAQWRVESVTVTEDFEEVYCAAVPGTHTFVLDDDLVTGNSWYTNNEMLQVDQGGRGLGKSVGVKMRAGAFPFAYEGQAMLLTAPELNHLRPLTDAIEKTLLSTRLIREMLPDGKGKGIARQPHWQVRFKNGTSLVSRLPNKDGKGVKGMHVINIELDEAQDYPLAGWIEIVETLNAGLPGAMWRCHGVSKGVRDKFFEKTQPESGWVVHRPMAMNRPTWGPEEREKKIREYGMSRQAIDYRRNIYGEHGDASNSVFVLARLMNCVDLDEGSTYNMDVYSKTMMTFESFPANATDDERLALMHSWIDLPGSHIHGYSQKIGNTEVGSPKGYSAYWAGMDVGVTNHPSEILVYGQRMGTDFLELLTRIQMHRINTDDQKHVVTAVMDFYGERIRFGIDKMQPVSEPVLTPTGWLPIGKLQVGDEVIGSDGQATEVTGVYPQEDRRVYRITCSDGSWTRCGPEHLWSVDDFRTGKRRTLTTEQLRALMAQASQRRYGIPMITEPSHAERVDLPLDPYVLGAFLGNGNLRAAQVRYSSSDAFVVEEINRRLPEGYRLRYVDRYDYSLVSDRPADRDGAGHFGASAVHSALRTLGLMGHLSHEKFVPDIYLHAHPQARLDVLRGLMDTDGHCTVSEGGRSTTIGFTSTSPALTEAVRALVESLGGSARIQTLKGKRQGLRPAWRVSVAMPNSTNPFLLPRKAQKVVPRKFLRRYVDTITVDEPEDSVCIRVAAQDHLYVTRHHLLTHNTGVGFPIWDQLTRTHYGKRIYGFGFSENRVCAFEDRPLVGSETIKDLARYRNFVEASTDWLRNDYVDVKRMRLPYDKEVLQEFQGQTYTVIRNTGDPYGGKRQFSGGSFHTLDAAKIAVGTKHIPPLEQMLESRPAQASVLDIFVGM